MSFLVDIICWIGRHRFIFLGIAIPLSSLIFIIRNIKTKKLNRFSFFGSLLLIYSIINIIWGNNIANALIYKYGESGKGTIVQIKSTNSSYNDQPVMAYDVILTTKDNKTIETSFESWDFNLYPEPKANSYTYPLPGIEFSVKYLKNNPNAFIIISNDSSTYAIARACQKKQEELATAKLKFNASPNNITYRKEYLLVLKNYVQMNCEKNEVLIDSYKKEIQTLESNP